MVRQHYSPRAELRLFEPEAREEMADAARRARADGKRVGALLRTPLDLVADQRIDMPDDPAQYAARFYSALHELDAGGCALILADAVPDDPEWAGLRDRLTRAAHSG
jgi:L-threonylcarbamoyladenylate synthase